MNDGIWRDFEDFVIALRGWARGASQADPRLRSAGMNQLVGSEGGFLIPDQFRAELLERIYADSLAGLCSQYPAKFNGLKIPYIDETSRQDGSRYGGVSGKWMNEGDVLTASKPKFGQFRGDANKLGVLAWATGELVDDSPALAQNLKKVLSAEAAFLLDDAIVNGSGAGRPRGLLNSPATIVFSKEVGQSAATITAANIIGMYSRLWGASRRRAVWLTNEATDGVLVGTFLNARNAANTENVSGTPIYNFGPDGEPRILGRPVIVTEQCPAIGAKGDLILADLSQYAIVPRGLFMASSIHQDFVDDQTAFRLIVRVDGSPTWKSPVTPKSGGATLSPFVTLEARS